MSPHAHTEPARTTSTPSARPGGGDHSGRLTGQECWARLSELREGRLGYASGRGPRHVVTRYAVRGRELVLRVPAYNEAAQYAPGREVTFDVVDSVGSGTASRIEVVGVAHLADPAGGVPDTLPDEHWPADLPSTLVCLRVEDVRGEIEHTSAARDDRS